MNNRKWYYGTWMLAVYIVAGVWTIMGLGAGSAWFGLGFGIVTVAYWTPTLIARGRHVPNVAQVAVVNIFGFLLGIAWVIALVMAFTDRQAPRYVRY